MDGSARDARKLLKLVTMPTISRSKLVISPILSTLKSWETRLEKLSLACLLRLSKILWTNRIQASNKIRWVVATSMKRSVVRHTRISLTLSRTRLHYLCSEPKSILTPKGVRLKRTEFATMFPEFRSLTQLKKELHSKLKSWTRTSICLKS